ncbi:hypothetical protein GCM10011399_10980 [Subtercola lobariae]|uniref:Uncharacterized protein n=1 Tax=Subtercola lobariae TaxID=1588641 RepID=A0A917B3F4_9MICO|nr:hypothetical protein GCM10011399_10980 [Subtercola lobariae]
MLCVKTRPGSTPNEVEPEMLKLVTHHNEREDPAPEVSLDTLLQQIATADQRAFSELYDRVAPGCSV